MTVTSSEEPVWLSVEHLLMLHAESIRLFGGLSGLRDRGLLEGALGRPRHLWDYGDKPSMSELAAAYAMAIARNHPFLDGNKRAALLAIRAFLFSNGVRFHPDEVATVAMMEGLASGGLDEEVLARWVEESCREGDSGMDR